MIEYKLNLILALFDMRDSGKANIVEVMIMAQSILKGFAKLYPTVRFFKNPEILDEIKPAILELFKDYIENEIKLD